MVFNFRRTDSPSAMKKSRPSSSKSKSNADNGGKGDIKKSIPKSPIAKTPTADTDDTSASSPRVSFAPYCIVAEYGMILGDNPAVSRGAPVQLDWSPQRIVMAPVSEEKSNDEDIDDSDYQVMSSTYLMSKHTPSSPRNNRHKNKSCPRLSSRRRTQILVSNAGYTLDQVADAILLVRQNQRDRRETRREDRREQKAKRKAEQSEGRDHLGRRVLEFIWDDELDDSDEDDSVSRQKTSSSSDEMVLFLNKDGSVKDLKRTSSNENKRASSSSQGRHVLFGRATGLWTPTQKTLTVTRNSSLWIKTF